MVFPKDSNIDMLNLGDRPDSSRLTWLANERRVLSALLLRPKGYRDCSQESRRVIYSRASAARIDWALKIARKVRQEERLDELRASAYINMIVNEDSEKAWRMAAAQLPANLAFRLCMEKLLAQHQKQRLIR